MPTINNPQDPSSPLFVTRNGRLLTNYDLDLATGHAYSIDNTPILSLNELGVTVTSSNLRSLGTLNSLEVEGDALLGGFALSFIGVIYALLTILVVLTTDISIPMGIPTIIVGIFFLGGIQLLFLGLIGEYVLSIHGQVRRLPPMFELERINLP